MNKQQTEKLWSKISKLISEENPHVFVYSCFELNDDPPHYIVEVFFKENDNNTYFISFLLGKNELNCWNTAKTFSKDDLTEDNFIKYINSEINLFGSGEEKAIIGNCNDFENYYNIENDGKVKCEILNAKDIIKKIINQLLISDII